MARDMADELGESKARKRKTARNPDHFYQRNATDFRDGTRKLSLAARGAYNDLVDLMYIHGGPIEDDDFAIACELRVKLKQWRKVRVEILASGKLSLVGGFIHNERADEELSKRAADRLLRTCRKAARTLPERCGDSAEQQDEGKDNNINGGCAEKTGSSTREPESKKLEAESENKKNTQTDSQQSDAARDLAGLNGSADPMLRDIEAWMNAGDPKAARNWLDTLVRQYGQQSVRYGYVKLKTEIAEGEIVRRPLQTWSRIAERRHGELARGKEEPTQKSRAMLALERRMEAKHA